MPLSAPTLQTRATLHAALGEPSRLAIVDALHHSEHTPSELGQRLGMDSNLLAYHLQVLVDAGLVERLISSGIGDDAICICAARPWKPGIIRQFPSFERTLCLHVQLRSLPARRGPVAAVLRHPGP